MMVPLRWKIICIVMLTHPRAASAHGTVPIRWIDPTDVISGHSYFNLGGFPEQVMKYIAQEKAMLSPADAAKPYFTGEGSWGKNDTVSGADVEAAFVPRWFGVLLLSHVDRGYWYAWDQFESFGTGGLWSPDPITFPPVDARRLTPRLGATIARAASPTFRRWIGCQGRRW